MKIRLLLTITIFSVLLSACAAFNPEPTDDLQGTLVAMQVQATVQSGQIAALNNQLFQPTATCPACPTCTPVPSPTQNPTTPTLAPSPTETPIPVGSISGSLGYPSEVIPALRIVAFDTIMGYYYWQNTVQGQSWYKFEELPVGTYYVLAYLIGNPSKTFYAAYSQFVPCGLMASCSDHSLIEVEVKAGQETSNVNPIDWYATDPAGLGWPPDPTINWD